jgi:peptidoglycan hydrolase CwlO-like protein
MTTNPPVGEASPSETRLDRLEALAETTLLAIQHQQSQINQQQSQINDLRASIVDVVGMVGTLAEQQNEMQQEMNETKQEIKGLRMESRRILDYLLNQRGEEDS